MGGGELKMVENEKNIKKRSRVRIPQHLIEEFQDENFSISRLNPGAGQAPIRGYRPKAEGTHHSPKRTFGAND